MRFSFIPLVLVGCNSIRVSCIKKSSSLVSIPKMSQTRRLCLSGVPSPSPVPSPDLLAREPQHCVFSLCPLLLNHVGGPSPLSNDPSSRILSSLAFPIRAATHQTWSDQNQTWCVARPVIILLWSALHVTTSIARVCCDVQPDIRNAFISAVNC